MFDYIIRKTFFTKTNMRFYLLTLLLRVLTLIRQLNLISNIKHLKFFSDLACVENRCLIFIDNSFIVYSLISNIH